MRNAVASLGTALTPEQAKLLGRFARRVVVNYDGDRAGVSAAKRAIETLLAEDFDIKVLVLPEGADPDEFIKSAGVEAYNERRGAALPHIQFVLDQAMRDRNLRRPADKAEAVEEVLPFVRAVRNRIQKREYFDMTMDALRVEEPALRRELWQSIAKPNAATGGGTDAETSAALQTKLFAPRARRSPSPNNACSNCSSTTRNSGASCCRRSSRTTTKTCRPRGL